MAPPNKRNTLGAILKKDGFVALMKRLETLSESESKELFSTNSEQPISALDQLVFHVPNYFYKKDEEEKDTDTISEGVFEFLQWAMAHNAHPNSTIKYGNSSFLKSCELKTKDLLEFYVNNVSDLNLLQQDGKGQDALMHSVVAQSEPVIDYLLSLESFNLNKQYILLGNKTVLHAACGLGNEIIIDKLISKGADLTLGDDYDNKPVDMIPTKLESPLTEEETTDEKVQAWEDLYIKIGEMTEKAITNKKVTKTYKTSF